MQGRVFAIITLGFVSLLLIGAAGAASDSYFETASELSAHKVACAAERMDSGHPDLAHPNCSVHRVSPTYGRQMMAMNMTQSRLPED